MLIHIVFSVSRNKSSVRCPRERDADKLSTNSCTVPTGMETPRAALVQKKSLLRIGAILVLFGVEVARGVTTSTTCCRMSLMTVGFNCGRLTSLNRAARSGRFCEQATSNDLCTTRFFQCAPKRMKMPSNLSKPRPFVLTDSASALAAVGMMLCSHRKKLQTSRNTLESRRTSVINGRLGLSCDREDGGERRKLMQRTIAKQLTMDTLAMYSMDDIDEW